MHKLESLKLNYFHDVTFILTSITSPIFKDLEVYNEYDKRDQRLQPLNLENLHGLLYKSLKVELKFHRCAIPHDRPEWLQNLIRTGFFKVRTEGEWYIIKVR